MLKEKGFNVDLAPMPNGAPHPFWDTNQAKVTLPNHTETFNTDFPLDLIKVRIMEGSTIVANSAEEVSGGQAADADFFIYSEDMEMEEKAQKINVVNRARKLALEMPQKRKIWLIQVLKGQTLRGKSQEFVDVVIDELITADVKSFIRYAEMEKDELFTRALIYECVHKGILTKDGPKIQYNSDVLGYDEEEALKYLSNAKNQAIKLRLMERVGITK